MTVVARKAASGLAKNRVGLISVGVALGFTGVLLLILGENPLEAADALYDGSFGSTEKIADTLVAWVPLTLAAIGLVVTFTAGMWNIGVEGQVIAGAIGAAFVAREVSGPSWMVVALTIVAAAVAGGLWALLAGLLRVYGRVNEIFGGLGLTFVAEGIAIYLVIGPWSRTGVASTSGTDPYPEGALLPTLGDLRVSPVALVVTVAAVVAVYYLLRGTSFGLRLRAVGQSMKSSHLLGIPTVRYLLAAFVIGGLMAGIAGGVRTTGFHGRFVPAVSGGFGYLAILIALLAGFKAKWVAPIALFFAAVTVGSSQLQLRLGLDSAFAGVVQGVLVLSVLFVQGWQARRSRRAGVQPPSAPEFHVEPEI